MKRLTPLIWLLLSSAPAFALDESAPQIPIDNRIKLLTYDESDVYTIVTRYGYQTNIVFSPKEEIQTISVGDRSMWQLIPSGHRLFIRPMEDNATTNMTILTNKRSYQFDLKSINSEKNGDNIYVARFIYPDEKKSQPAIEPVALSPAVVDAPVGEPVTLAPAPITPTEPSHRNRTRSDQWKPGQPYMPYTPPDLTKTPVASAASGITQPVYPNYNYTFSGPDELSPLQAYDDGKSTYVKLRDANAQLPNAYIVEGGKERPTTYYIKDGLLVFDSIASEFVLKQPAGSVTIYNEMLNPKS